MFKNKFLIPFIISAFLVSFTSCSKKTDDTAKTDEQQTEYVNIDENDLSETDNDLQTVDYKEVYDKLSSKGEWVQVSAADLGMDVKSSSSTDNDFQRSLVSLITGVNDVNAADANASMVFVWKPADNLGVSISNDQPAAYVPYSNGQWVNTDAGWYFKAPTPEEEIVHHYGRWTQTGDAGWVWVPGRVWSPAWVDWRQDENNIAWAPVPPSAYVVDNSFPVPLIDDSRYVVVEKKYFVEPYVYKYYPASYQRVVYRNWNRPDGIIIVNKTIINRGPDVKIIEQHYGRPVEFVKIKHVKDYDRIVYSQNEYSVFTPNFKKVKYRENVHTTVFQPQTFVRYDDVKEKYKKENDEREKIKGNDDKKIENDPRDNKTMHGNDKKLGDDRDMHKDKHLKGNGNEKHEKGNDNGKHDKGNDNGKKDNGNKDKGHDKGDKDNGNKDKGNKDNGNKDKGHGKK